MYVSITFFMTPEKLNAIFCISRYAFHFPSLKIWQDQNWYGTLIRWYVVNVVSSSIPLGLKSANSVGCHDLDKFVVVQFSVIVKVSLAMKKNTFSVSHTMIFVNKFQRLKFSYRQNISNSSSVNDCPIMFKTFFNSTVSM